MENHNPFKIAFYAIGHDECAFAAKHHDGHRGEAFQASSPKTSTARPATVGPFFVPCFVRRSVGLCKPLLSHETPGFWRISMIALFAMSVSHFALAQKRRWGHKDHAFQASSPKLPSPASAGFFFARFARNRSGARNCAQMICAQSVAPSGFSTKRVGRVNPQPFQHHLTQAAAQSAQIGRVGRADQQF